MFCTTLETEGDIEHVKLVWVPVVHYRPFQGGSFVVVLCCLFLCQSFSDVSPYVCSYCFGSVWVGLLSGHLLGKS